MSIRLRAIALLVAAAVLGGCSAGPVSQATTLPASETAGAGTSPFASAAEPSTSGADVSTPPEGPASPSAATSPLESSSAPPAPTGIPPKPGNPTWTLTKETPTTGGITVEHEVTWTEPEGVASEFLVYGVTKCLRYAKKNDGTPCLVRGMQIPRTSLKLLGRAPGDARSMTVSWEIGGAGPEVYQSILIRATNSFGDSIFTIVHTEDVCYQCTY
jgi:hypothetical protein